MTLHWPIVFLVCSQAITSNCQLSVSSSPPSIDGLLLEMSWPATLVTTRLGTMSRNSRYYNDYLLHYDTYLRARATPRFTIHGLFAIRHGEANDEIHQVNSETEDCSGHPDQYIFMCAREFSAKKSRTARTKRIVDLDKRRSLWPNFFYSDKRRLFQSQWVML